MNKLDETQLANVSLRLARKAFIDDINGSTENEKDSRLFMDYAYQVLITSYPWPFATTRDELPSSDEAPVRSYRKFFEIPKDVYLIWDFYYNPTDYPSYGDYWDYNYYRYYSFGDDAGGFFDGVGELIENKIASNHPQLFALYTKKTKFAVKDWSVPFATTMVNTMAIMHEHGSTTDPEMLRMKLAAFE